MADKIDALLKPVCHRAHQPNHSSEWRSGDWQGDDDSVWSPAWSIERAYSAQAIDAYKAERDTLRSQLEAAEASLDRLTGMKFSDRMSAALLSRAVAAEADAARYRWLKMKCCDVADEHGTAGQLYFGTFAVGQLDAAIDAARAAQEGK